MKSDKLQKAIALAKKHHDWQKRKTWEEYVEHPLRVMAILERHWFDEDILVASILHDMCEDTEITNIQIIEMFWEKVWFTINALTKNKKPNIDDWWKKCIRKNSDFNSRFLMYINRFYWWILAEPSIMFIKMADQIDNLSSLEVFAIEKRLRKIREVEEYFLPMYDEISSVLTWDMTKKYSDIKSELLSIIKEQKELIS